MLPPNKLWTEDDLQDEFFLTCGLKLLMNEINDHPKFLLGHGVHIKYTMLSKEFMVTSTQKYANKNVGQLAKASRRKNISDAEVARM